MCRTLRRRWYPPQTTRYSPPSTAFATRQFPLGLPQYFAFAHTSCGVAAAIPALVRPEREAQLLAALNHPNIEVIHGLEESDGVRFMVLELIEGESLAEKLSRGRIEVEKALGIARQIAEALEAAHAKGIIQRDLKPGNVVITPEGQAKVLDFGLAKGGADDGTSLEVSPDITESPTVAAATRAGIILGTAAYMSPEQARGKPFDKRTDIWSFGCVLYEMLTVRRPFDGETVTDVIPAIVEREPDWSAVPGNVPAIFRLLLRQCLETVHAAHQFGMEPDAGSLEVGQLADFVVLHRNPWRSTPTRFETSACSRRCSVAVTYSETT